MRIAIIDESASRAAVIHEGLAALENCEIFVVTERRSLIARIGEIAPDIVLIDLGNPSRDVLEEYFAVSRALARPIAMFVDESDDEALEAAIDAIRGPRWWSTWARLQRAKYPANCAGPGCPVTPR